MEPVRPSRMHLLDRSSGDGQIGQPNGLTSLLLFGVGLVVYLDTCDYFMCYGLPSQHKCYRNKSSNDEVRHNSEMITLTQEFAKEDQGLVTPFQ